jgi:hypothetical protein
MPGPLHGAALFARLKISTALCPVRMALRRWLDELVRAVEEQWRDSGLK